MPLMLPLPDTALPDTDNINVIFPPLETMLPHGNVGELLQVPVQVPFQLTVCAFVASHWKRKLRQIKSGNSVEPQKNRRRYGLAVMASKLTGGGWPSRSSGNFTKSFPFTLPFAAAQPRN